MMIRKFLCVAILIFFVAASSVARADCTDPVGVEGQIIYNLDFKAPQFCDGTNWWSMKSGGGGLPACSEGDALIVSGGSWICTSSLPTPVVVGTQTSNNSPSRTTSTNVAFPAGVVSGELLLIAIATEVNASGPTTPSGWSETLPSISNGGEPGTRLTIFHRVADGSEGGSVTISHGNNDTAAISYRISGAMGTPEATGTFGTTTAPDPPNFSPSWGSTTVNTLWLAVASSQNQITFSSYPAGFDGEVVSTNLNDANVASAKRSNLSASTNPGTFGLSGSGKWVAATVAIRPSSP